MVHVDHVSATPAARQSRVVIEIWLDASPPPSGRVVIAGREEEQPFDGWLQLLHILADVINREPHAEPASG